MNVTQIQELLNRASAWPQEDQRELADYARVIEARRTGIYRIGPDERTAIDQGIAQADRGEFVADEEVARARKRNGA